MLEVRTREQLLHLLTEAAEIEHDLLCCYLYAAFSLKRGEDEELTAREAEAVARWRRTVIGVAIEEMAHLALVANMTVAIGARPHFNRPNFPVAPGYHPAGIVAELAPFDADTLAHFVYLERPEDVELRDGAGFVGTEYVREPHLQGLMPSAHEYETIGQLYEALRQGFSHLAMRIGEERLFLGAKAMQVGPKVLGLQGLAYVTDLRSAHAAIDTIIEQGEGSATCRSAECHFARFGDIQREYAGLVGARPDFRPARAVARNPVMRRPVDRDRVHIDAPKAVPLLDVANALYNQMLRALAEAYGRPRMDDTQQKALVDAAVGLMKVLDSVASYLTTLPARADGGTERAGVTFTTLRSTEPLTEGGRAKVFLAERFEELAAGVDATCGGIPALAPAVERMHALNAAFARNVAAI